MKKAITKVTACSVIIAMAISAFTVNVSASSILPAAGIAASTGVGSTLSDITAKRARALAKEKSAKVHARITVPNQVAGGRRQVVGFRFQVAGFRWQVAGFKFQALHLYSSVL